MTTRHKTDKIHEALDLLNEAAKEKGEELYEIAEDKYSHIKDAFLSSAGNGKAFLNREQRKLAKSLQHNPWPYVGAAALSALVIGLVLGKK